MRVIAVANEKNRITISELHRQDHYDCYLHEHDFVKVQYRRRIGKKKLALNESRKFIQCITCNLIYCESCGKIVE